MSQTGCYLHQFECFILKYTCILFSQNLLKVVLKVVGYLNETAMCMGGGLIEYHICLSVFF